MKKATRSGSQSRAGSASTLMANVWLTDAPTAYTPKSPSVTALTQMSRVQPKQLLTHLLRQRARAEPLGELVVVPGGHRLVHDGVAVGARDVGQQRPQALVAVG